MIENKYFKLHPYVEVIKDEVAFVSNGELIQSRSIKTKRHPTDQLVRIKPISKVRTSHLIFLCLYVHINTICSF